MWIRTHVTFIYLFFLNKLEILKKFVRRSISIIISCSKSKEISLLKFTKFESIEKNSVLQRAEKKFLLKPSDTGATRFLLY